MIRNGRRHYALRPALARFGRFCRRRIAAPILPLRGSSMFFLVSVARRIWIALDSAPPPRAMPFTAADQPSSPTAACWILHAR